jgi:hypothetical protein
MKAEEKLNEELTTVIGRIAASLNNTKKSNRRRYPRMGDRRVGVTSACGFLTAKISLSDVSPREKQKDWLVHFDFAAKLPASAPFRASR